MSRTRLVVAVTVGALVALLQLAPAASAEDALTVVSTDVAAYPDIKVVVAGPPQLGDQVLGDGSVKVVEGGQVRPVRVQALPPEELEVSLVIDTSGSMVRGPLAAAKAAAKTFLAQLPPAVPVSVIGFGASPAVLSPRSSNRAAQLAAVDGMSAAGETALYDALRMGLEQLPTSGGRRMIVLLTDGGDTTSKATLGATAGALGAARVPLFAVELTTKESNPSALNQLTSASAGRLVEATDPRALGGAFDAVAKQLVHQYAVTYPSQASGSTDIEIVLEASGVRSVARPHLDLPAASVRPVSRPSAPFAQPPRGSSPLGGWALVVGAALCGASLLALLLGGITFRTPRARGLATRDRGTGLSGAAGWAESVGDGVLRRSGRVDGINEALELAGIDVRAGELLVAVAVVAVTALAAGTLLLDPIMGLLLAILVPVITRVAISHLAARRRKKFSAQVGETLQILAGSLRAGHGLAEGIETVAREAESPSAEEFRRLTIEARLGRDFVEALAALADRAGSKDLQWVAQAVEIQRDVGGDLAEILDTVATTIRDRTRIRLQVSALSAEGRMSAWVLMSLPFGLGAIMAVTNPTYLSPMFKTSTGLTMLGFGAALLTVGGLWLRRMVKPIF